MIVNNGFWASQYVYNSWTTMAARRSCLVYNSCGLTQSQIKTELISAHILYLKPKSHHRSIWGGPECGNRISDANFVIVFHSNYGSILLSFPDMTMGRTAKMYDGSTAAIIIYGPSATTRWGRGSTGRRESAKRRHFKNTATQLADSQYHSRSHETGINGVWYRKV